MVSISYVLITIHLRLVLLFLLMEFVDLKEKAQETYGSAYSDIAFHKALLSIGPAPFSIIETYLDDYYLPDAAPQ